MIDRSDREIHRTLTENNLPSHPLRKHGYLSIGEWHTTLSIQEVDDAEKLRSFGLGCEWGLHDPDFRRATT